MKRRARNPGGGRRGQRGVTDTQERKAMAWGCGDSTECPLTRAPEKKLCLAEQGACRLRAVQDRGGTRQRKKKKKAGDTETEKGKEVK